MMSKPLMLTATLVLGGVVVGSMVSRPAETIATPVSASTSDLVARGEYLVMVGGCNDCHTPWILTENGPAPDMTRMLSGHPADLPMPPPPETGGSPWMWGGAASNTAFYGPWGVSYARNLTPHPISGMGAVWTEEMFVKALRTGKHYGESRPILPPMPWENYGKMTDHDLKAVWTYLQSIPPVHNEVPDIPIPVKKKS